MGGKTQTTQQQVTIPPEVLARYNAVNARAENVAQTPFQPYSYNPNAFVAPLTQTQQAAIGNINQAQGQTAPYYGAAAGMTLAGSQGVTPSGLDVGAYFNPFTNYVAGATEAALNQQQGQQLSQQQTNAIKGGAFGGDRAGIERAVLMGQQNLARAQALSPIYQQGYQQALQTAQQQQGVGLQAEQANLERLLKGGQQLAGVAGAQQQSALQGAQAQLGAGTAEQQTQQAGLQALYNQFLQERGYPFQIAQFLANIAMGTGALSGSTTTTTAPAPFFSDEREKTNIQPLGKGLYAYDYKHDVEAAERTGAPMPPKRVGPMAQDIEKRNPGLVIDVNDYKVVNPIEKADGGGFTMPAPTAMRSGLVPQVMGMFGGQPRGPMPTVQAGAAMPQGAAPQAQAAPAQGQQASSWIDRLRGGDVMGGVMQGMGGLMGGAFRVMGAPSSYYDTLNQSLAPWGGYAGKGAAQAPNYNPGVAPPRYASGGYVDEPGFYDRGGFAPGGLVSPQDMDAILKSQQQFLGPYMTGQGGPYGGQQQGKPGYIPQASLPVAKLTTAGGVPQQQKSGLAQAAETGSQLAGLAKMGSDVYDWGKAKWKENGKPEVGGVASATGGADGTSGAGNIFTDVADMFPRGYAHGGLAHRYHYAGGGSMPYSGDDILQGVIDDGKDEIRSLPKPGEPPKQGQSGLGGLMDLAKTGSSLASLGSAASSGMDWIAALPFFLSRGGRAGYAQGGEPDLPAIDAQEAGLVPTFKVPEEYAPIIEQASRETGIPAAIIAAKIKAESGFNPRARGKAGEEGVSQIRPSTARDPGFGLEPETGDLTDPRVAIPFGARYLKARGDAAGVTNWNDAAEAAKGLAGYNGTGPAAQRYAQNVLAFTRDDGQPGGSGKPPGLGSAPAPRPTGVMPGIAGPGRIQETPENSPFRFFTDKMLQGRDIDPDTKKAATSENLWVPLLAGVGSMLASRSPYLGNAIGEGLVGGTKAYTDLNKQQQDMAESRGRVEAGMANIASSALQVVDGRLMVRVARPGGGYTMVEYQTIRSMSPAERAKYNIDPRIVEEGEQFLRQRGEGGSPASAAPASAPAAPKAPEAPKPAATPAPPNALPHEVNPPGSPVDRQTTVGGISLSPEQIERARSITQERAGFGEKERLAEPDYFKPQYELARSSENSKQQLVPLAGALAALPRDKSVFASGPVQSIAAPIMAVANNLGSVLGYKFETNDPRALQEEVDKLTTRLKTQETTSAQQRALGALQEMAKGLPSYLNSPGGQAKLVPQLLTENQREIDRQNFFRVWENAAAGERGQNAQYAKLSSRDANEAFEKEFNESVRAQESAALEKMFNRTFPIKDPETGKTRNISAMEYITKYGAAMRPEQKQKFRDEFGKGLKHDILRYFGVP